MESKKIQVGRMEHYAIYIALVISMVTTFLLGVLLTESLFGTGLNYFGRLSEEAKIGKASAALCYTSDGDSSSDCSQTKRRRGGGSSTAPTAPVATHATVLPGSVSIDFYDLSTNEEGFNLERSDGSLANWEVVTTIGAFTCDPNIYTCDPMMPRLIADSNAPILISPQPYPSSVLAYRVRAFNGGASSASDIISVVPFYDATPPTTPDNVSYVSQSCRDARHHVTFTWDEATDLPELGAAGRVYYHAYYASPTLPGYWVNLGYFNSSATDSTIHYMATTTRTYTVAAIDGNGNEGSKATPIDVDVTPCL
ncbi:MAG: hypothetical protein AAB490_04285 [Patescibacteria group bacterium]